MKEINIVCANIIERNKKILFVKESKKIALGRYNFPAGKLEFGESILEGAIREAKEETNLNIELVRLVGIYQRPSSHESSNTTVFCFHSQIKSGKIKESQEHPEVKFLGWEEIKNLDKQHKLRSKYIIPALKDYWGKKGININFLKIIK